VAHIAATTQHLTTGTPLVGEQDAPPGFWDGVVSRVGYSREQVGRGRGRGPAARSQSRGGLGQAGRRRTSLWPWVALRGRPPATLAPLPHVSQVALIVTIFELLQVRMDGLHQERELLCQLLAAAAAPPSQGSDTAPGLPVAASSGDDSRLSGGAAGRRDAAAATAAAEAAAAPRPPPLLRFDSFTEQSEIADQIAANTARMGRVQQLHFTTIYAILTDLQRARMSYLCFPFAVNVSKCVACATHMLKFEPGSLPPAAELDLRSEMACWASPAAGPAPAWRWAGIGAAGGTGGGVGTSGAGTAGAAAAGSATAVAAGAAASAATSPAASGWARQG
jgi:hypothetical protein